MWTTLALTVHADGHSEFELVGASTFPRHWVYDEHGKLAAKAGMADFKDWWRHSFGKHTPWGDQDSPALVTAVETALERELAGHIMRGGGKSSIRKLKEGGLLTEQGSKGDDVFLLLNGVVSVEVDVSWAAIIRKIMWLTMSLSEKVFPSSSAVWHSTVSMSLPVALRRARTRSAK